MSRTWLTGLCTGGVVGLLALALTQSIHAQPAGGLATGRVACCDVVMVFNEFQRQKDLREEIAETQKAVEAEDERRRQEIDGKLAELDVLDKNDPTLPERTRALRAITTDYRVWREMKQQDMTAEIGRWSIHIYQEIRAAVADIAERNGYDLVLYRGEFEAVSMDPEVVKDQIQRIQILYAEPRIDISQAVIDKLNSDYRAQPKTKMLNVP